MLVSEVVYLFTLTYISFLDHINAISDLAVKRSARNLPFSQAAGFRNSEFFAGKAKDKEKGSVGLK